MKWKVRDFWNFCFFTSVQKIIKWTLCSFLHKNWLLLFIFSTDSPSFLHVCSIWKPAPPNSHHTLPPCFEIHLGLYISYRWMCTIEYNGTQTLAIRPSYVCTQDPTECPIPLQWTSIHPFIELPVIKYKIQIQISNTKYQYNDWM